MSTQNALNHFMVDYDIVCILKEYAGYTSLSDVPMNERETAAATTMPSHFSLNGMWKKKSTTSDYTMNSGDEYKQPKE